MSVRHSDSRSTVNPPATSGSDARSSFRAAAAAASFSSALKWSPCTRVVTPGCQIGYTRFHFAQTTSPHTPTWTILAVINRCFDCKMTR
jgi:hypothetical protein